MSSPRAAGHLQDVDETPLLGQELTTAMPNVIADITMSLDGYVTGPGADAHHGLGDAPELHTWVTERDAVDTEILEGATAQSGAVVMGRRLFDIVDGPGGWNEDMGYGADQRRRVGDDARRRTWSTSPTSACSDESQTHCSCRS